MNGINSTSLIAFAEIIRSGSFDAAAKTLHITPSAVSQRIRQLEEVLGQVLIIRGTPCRATAAGTLLYRHAEQVQALEADFFTTLKESSRRTLALAVNTDSIDGWFLDALAEATASGIMLELKVEDQDFSATLLREGKVMAAVSAGASPVQGCSTLYLGRMRYRAYASRHFMATHFTAQSTIDNLTQAPSIFFNDKDALQSAFLRAVSGQTLTPPTLYIPSTSAYVAAIVRGLGWGMLPDYMAAPHLESGRIAAFCPEHSVDVPLYWHRWNIPLSGLDRVTDFVQAAAARHLLA